MFIADHSKLFCALWADACFSEVADETSIEWMPNNSSTAEHFHFEDTIVLPFLRHAQWLFKKI